jgi:hypothetical protein
MKSALFHESVSQNYVVNIVNFRLVGLFAHPVKSCLWAERPLHSDAMKSLFHVGALENCDVKFVAFDRVCLFGYPLNYCFLWAESPLDSHLM